MRRLVIRIGQLAFVAMIACTPILHSNYYKYLFSGPGPHGPLGG
jgi:hypothetical protein